ncbi:MAG: 30S ribosomal protein S8 [Opitutaceae bacterium]|nr:30S ribosomal protein S8 [Opitutaceae bacterium]|tara:strand:- start:4791 stop:5183 length:393 start_codon:yes stop_codon:yes gene_type:complete
MTDPIADFLTQLRNAFRAEREFCRVQHSKMKQEIARILQENGYIKGYSEEEEAGNKKFLKVELKYVNGESAITVIERYSRPGRRLYFGSNDVPKVLGGLGAGIITTSRGLMTDREARQQNVGGELVCRVW